ncbi:hypothetical protein CJU90_3761 [Yarrowia sp. C11]|nr:hypothetical protein CKK34_5371 [Yarrowia sp. E02]KAG5367465.1 hypothetical protein CJU90_3761 [Yarrowia sp. C11]
MTTPYYYPPDYNGKIDRLVSTSEFECTLAVKHLEELIRYAKYQYDRMKSWGLWDHAEALRMRDEYEHHVITLERKLRFYRSDLESYTMRGGDFELFT